MRRGCVEAFNLPGNYLGDKIPRFVGIQCRDDVEQIVPASDAKAKFWFDVRLVEQDGAIDLRGPFIHGRKADRFLYLSWGHAAEIEPFVRYARSKLMFNDVPPGLLERLYESEELTLVASVQATNSKGTEASGTVRPPSVAWQLVPASSTP